MSQRSLHYRLRSALICMGLLLVTVVCASLGVAQESAKDFKASIKAMEWRFIGPIVGCRGTSVAGHPTDKMLFFHGSAGGGLWKTEDAGQYWEPVGDGQFKMGSVGAIALYEKNPNIMYVGMGEPNMRHSVSWGDGVYKTTDGGKTWTNIGLKESKHIGRVRIHPDNPDLVYVAAIGHAFGPNKERGVFRSKDGGKTWKNVLFKSERTGAIDLVINPSKPKQIFATMFQFDRKAWGVIPGGPESGIWRSMDGGDTWEDITRNPGLPKGQMGRVGITMSAANPNRVYALVDSETKQGVYRSDDLGQTWKLVSDNPNLPVRPFYFMHIYANPSNEDEVWVLTNKLWKSIDGGENWTQYTGTKDDFHDMWIDPTDSNRMIVIHDGGAMVSLNGAKTWSRFDVQRTAQFYRLGVDNQWPYNLYASSQDTLAFKVPSASRWGGISGYDTVFVGDGESGWTYPHPTIPDLVYIHSTAALVSLGGAISLVNLKTGQEEARNIWPETLYGVAPAEHKYRFNWDAPLAISPHDPETIYLAGNVVFRSTDRGMSWEKISDDLTTDDKETQKVSGTSWMFETTGQEIFNAVNRMQESPLKKGLLWVGSDDGLVHVTRDGGKTWQNVTPPNLPKYASVFEVEPSPHDPAKAYIAMSRYETADDYSPYLFRTTDYGKTWERIDESFPKVETARTIREDTVRKGLLFVGTETGVFTSIDDGKKWRRLNLNLPHVAVHDIKVKHEDLCIATHGRGFWILDDISPLRQYSDNIARKNAHLFKPRTHIRFGYNWWLDYGGGVRGKKNYFVKHQRPGHTFYELGVVNGEKKRKFIDAGDARPNGPIIYYLLSDKAKDVSLTILDEVGNEIKSFGKDEITAHAFKTIDRTGYGHEAAVGERAPVSVGSGLNRFIWDMRYPNVTPVPGRSPVSIAPFAKPGTYQARLTVDGESQTQPFELRINPNETYTREQTDAKFAYWMKVRNKAEQGAQAVIKAHAIKKQVSSAMKQAKAGKIDAGRLKQLQELADKINAGCDALDGAFYPRGLTLVQIVNEPSKLQSKLATVSDMAMTSEGPVPQGGKGVYEFVAGQMDAKLAQFDALTKKEVAQFNKLSRGLQKAGK
jgi:photosystem II stability/assembly factor-like uncharacterized protein